jgi:DNA polymerase-3 subunit gamma/tau
MGHIALYRKWRPQVWDDLVGQEHISRTLINAIATNRITHAYLFCGSRGTGKTTTARILAKALNCDAKNNGSPCNTCPNCLELNNGSAMDVIEIDAASNRGINEIRSLIEQVRFASVTGKYKVYIIDEFHMLTTEAFNAILKTLEEPPAKVVFVLATTEAHKILPTIISRCQRFDFQRIPVSALVDRLRYISDQEGIIISNDSLLSIARKANGGLRDAISLLDQISAFSTKQGEIPDELVYQVLGLVSTDILSGMAEAIANSEPIKIMEIITELLKAGNDPIVIMTETITFFRNLLVVKSAPETAEYLEVPAGNMESLKKICSLFTVADILNNLEYLNETIERVKKTQMAQLWLEVNFVQLCKKSKIQNSATVSAAAPQADISMLINKIDQLEKRLESMTQAGFTAPQNLTPHPNTNSNAAVPITNINDYKAGIGSEKPANQEQQPVTGQKSPYNLDLASIWERILHETKKKSIPAAAILEKGTLADVDAKINTVTVKFDNEGFIELLKKKHQGVEYALGIVFGAPYRLVMEKGSLVKEEKKNSKLDNVAVTPQFSSPSGSTLPQNYPQSSEQNAPEIYNQDNSQQLSQAPAEINNINQTNFSENPISENFYVRIDSIQQHNVNNEQAESTPTTVQVMEKVEGYSQGYPAEITEPVQDNFVASYADNNTQSGSNNPEGENELLRQQNDSAGKPEDFLITHRHRKSEKEIYFAEVADIFKGKIINKVKQ